MRTPTLKSTDSSFTRRLRWHLIHIDPWLTLGIIAICCAGLLILYSATNENLHMVIQQAMRMGLGFMLLFICAQIPPRLYARWAPWLYAGGIMMLMTVLIVGHVGQGARRWLVLGPIRFQPSEFMKIIVPMGLAWYFNQTTLPPKTKPLLIGAIMLALPFLLTAKQPDLGTAILIGSVGASVIFYAGIRWRVLVEIIVLSAVSMPVVWHFMHHYQKNRILIFLNPERAPLGSGYHIIQSKIAIGSGGVLGKGWLHGTQSHLAFLPAHTTDFIFAVSGEELGLIGSCVILALFLLVFMRCLFLSRHAHDSFGRLLGGALSFMFIISALINIGMVIGILPVVGVPLPLISYGGSSIVTIMASFGMIMSIYTHKSVWYD